MWARAFAGIVPGFLLSAGFVGLLTWSWPGPWQATLVPGVIAFFMVWIGVMASAFQFANGKRAWAEGDFGNGQLVLAGDVFVISTERGSVVLVAADPTEFRELGRTDVFTARTWNMPALAGNQYFVRNHREMACLELPTK